MTDQGAQSAPRKKKKPAPNYVKPNYPARLGYASVVWGMLGWILAAAAPHLAFVPLVGVLHYLFPAITVGLIAANLFFALREFRRGVHVLSLLVVTGLQIGLFTTLFFQLYSHLGAELFDVDGPTSSWQWVMFSLAHAFRASDVLDIVEAYNLKIQPIKHDSSVVAIFVIGYHLVVDVFFLGVLWEAVARLRRNMLKDESIRNLVFRTLQIAFYIWLVSWLAFALFLRPWNKLDIPLWLIENALRVFDFADIMESFSLRLHTLPREGVVGTLTFFCRLWMAIGVALVLSQDEKRVRRGAPATPPGVESGPFWRKRVLAVVGVLLLTTTVGLVAATLLGRPSERLASAAGSESESRAKSALRALRRMGPGAAEALPQLLTVRRDASPAIQDEITRTMGYLGTAAEAPLIEIALTESEEQARVAVRALRTIGPESAPALALVWEKSANQTLRDAAASELRALRREAVGPLMVSANLQNAATHYHWLKELDSNWQLRRAPNELVASLQELPEVSRRLGDKLEPQEQVRLLKIVKNAGSAAKEYLPQVIVLLGVNDGTVRVAAREVVVSMGTAATPELLKLLQTNNAGQAADEIVTVLADDNLWDESVMRDPAALPVLLGLLNSPGGLRTSTHRLGAYGEQAQAAVPLLLKHLTTEDAFRTEVRATLTKIDANWKKHPQYDAILAPQLLRLGNLPMEEVDELLASFGSIPESAANDVLEAINARMRERTDSRNYGASPEEIRDFKSALDTAYGPIEKLGPKAAAMTGPLLGQLGRRDSNNPRVGLTHDRIMQVLEAIVPDKGALLVLLLPRLEKEAQLAFLKKYGATGIPEISKFLRGNNGENLQVGVQAATMLGPLAKPLVPDLMALLSQPNAKFTIGGKDEWALPPIVRALDSVDPTWWGKPEAANLFAATLARRDIDSPEAQKMRSDMVGLISTAASKAKPLIPALATELLRRGGTDRPTWKALDEIDPSWRASSAVKKYAKEAAERMSQGVNRANEETLLALGTLAVPGLIANLARPEPALRDRSLVVLMELGPTASEAVPALVALLDDPKMTVDLGSASLRTLKAIDPDWAVDPRLKEPVAKALASLMKKAESEGSYWFLVGQVGPVGLAEVVKRMSTSSGNLRASLINVLAGLEKSASSARPALQGLLKDRDPSVRRQVVSALARIGAGDPEFVSAIGPALLDVDANVRRDANLQLPRLDPQWQQNPRLASIATQAAKNLASADLKLREAALEALASIGSLDAPTVIPALEKLIRLEKDAARKNQAETLLQMLKSKK